MMPFSSFLSILLHQACHTYSLLSSPFLRANPWRKEPNLSWHDTAIVIDGVAFNDRASVMTVLSADHGRHRGLVYGIHAPAERSVWQLGNRLQLEWRGRLAEQLGVFNGEVLATPARMVFDDSLRLATLTAACALAATSLPEQLPQPQIFAGLDSLLGLLASDYFLLAFVRWEVELLAALGFGLDLSVCAVSGKPEELAFVSPRTGRAVGLAAAGPYRDRLLPLPAFLIPAAAAAEPDQPADRAAALAGLRLSGYFLEHRVYAALHQTLPVARRVLENRLANASTVIF
ncbi:MAG: DNA repair protein RecO [Alphaproteobacteria bacterium]|nr:DNA repair protein RecO [Alphaproteobacteria bacterium]